MKKILVGIAFLLITESVFSQNWDLFVKGQNSYYKRQSGNSGGIENFLFDSVSYSGAITVEYFNRQSGLKHECYEELYHQYNIHDWPNLTDKIDSLRIVNDSVLFISDYAGIVDTFLFKPLAKLNDSWITNGIEIKCFRTQIMDILGIQDSVKIFSCSGLYDSIEFILSKTYGLIKFLPFREFLFHYHEQEFSPYFELIGFSKDGISKGYKPPDFTNYFHLDAGDQLFWRIFAKGRPEPDVISYRMDSITYSFISNDSVYYAYRSKYFDENGSLYSTIELSDFFTRKYHGAILSSSTSWFGILNENRVPAETFYFESLLFTIENNDTTTYARYQLPGIFIDTLGCIAGMAAADYDLTVGFSTREGLNYQASFSFGEYSSTVIGSIINGVEHGETNIPTKINEIAADEIKIYPNPFTEYLNINIY